MMETCLCDNPCVFFLLFGHQLTRERASFSILAPAQLRRDWPAGRSASHEGHSGWPKRCCLWSAFVFPCNGMHVVICSLFTAARGWLLESCVWYLYMYVISLHGEALFWSTAFLFCWHTPRSVSSIWTSVGLQHNIDLVCATLKFHCQAKTCVVCTIFAVGDPDHFFSLLCKHYYLQISLWFQSLIYTYIFF